ncbi:MAG: hypothetical protein JWM32_2946 [Verrucomicrobia bacterium]|nr:hypothetical protein [Verrucomicrobiota bacterium]
MFSLIPIEDLIRRLFCILVTGALTTVGLAVGALKLIK